ncbi:MAG: hypothetical protein NZ959_06980 [Armatimonadetes bacterium]|nr:hypothetical protein [Armatimonadota bacterium]MDW8122334.1 hypothetical protein [Armatimonadota bacterium]
MGHFVFSVGDASGDLYASRITRKLKSLKPDCHISGIGGLLMQKEGAHLWAFTPPFGAFGLFSSLKVAPYHWLLLNKMKRSLLANPPDLFLPIDFGTFNRPLVRLLGRLGRKVFYYVPPSFVGESPEKVHRLVSPSVVFSPIYWWQKEILEKARAQIREFGHPLVDILTPYLTISPKVARDRLQLPSDRPIVALLPGSRRTTVADHARVLFRSAEKVHHLTGAHFAVALPDGWRREWIEPRIRPFLPAAAFSLHIGHSHWVLRASDVAVCAAGTATLEAAYLGTPSIAFFRTHIANRLQLHWLRFKGLSVDRLGPFALPNRILRQQVMPELIGWTATEENLMDCLYHLIKDPDAQSQMTTDLIKVRDSMGEPGVLERVSQFVSEWAGERTV